MSWNSPLSQIASGRTLKHGTFQAYNKFRCRCEVCRKYVNEYRAARKAEKQAAVGKDPE